MERCKSQGATSARTGARTHSLASFSQQTSRIMDFFPAAGASCGSSRCWQHAAAAPGLAITASQKPLLNCHSFHPIKRNCARSVIHQTGASIDPSPATPCKRCRAPLKGPERAAAGPPGPYLERVGSHTSGARNYRTRSGAGGHQQGHALNGCVTGATTRQHGNTISRSRERRRQRIWLRQERSGLPHATHRLIAYKL